MTENERVTSPAVSRLLCSLELSRVTAACTNCREGKREEGYTTTIVSNGKGRGGPSRGRSRADNAMYYE